MTALSLGLAVIGGVTFTVANLILWTGAHTATLRRVGALFTVGSVCFLASTLLQIWTLAHA